MADDQADNGKPNANSSHPDPPGRVAAAWGVLRGRYIVDPMLQAEWAEYKLAFTDLIVKFNAMLARLARAQQKEAESRLQEEERHAPQTPTDRKAELRHRAAALRGYPTVRRGVTNVGSDQEG